MRWSLRVRSNAHSVTNDMVPAPAANMTVCRVAGTGFAADSISQYELAMKTPAVDTTKAFETDSLALPKSDPSGTRKEMARTTWRALVQGETPAEETAETPIGSQPDTVRVAG